MKPETQLPDIATLDPPEPTGSPEEFGFPSQPTATQTRTWTLQESFLAELSDCGAIFLSAERAGHSPWTYYKWVDTDKYNFQKRFDLALRRYLEKMEVEADRRGMKGVDKDIYYLGDVVGSQKVYSDNLLMIRMKKLDPSYRDNYSVMEDVSAIRESLEFLKQIGSPRFEPPKVVEVTGAVVSDDE